MAIYSYPYVSTAGDRKITSQNEADRLNLVVGSGVVFDSLNSFACSKSNTAMCIDVMAGSAIIGGRAVISDAVVTTAALANGHATLSRIDLIVLESNTNTGVRGGRIVVVPGTPGAGEPNPVWVGGVYQIKLIAVTVPANAVTLAAATLTDRRTVAFGKHGHTISDITDLVNQLAGKAPMVHTHDDRYYTEAEIDAALALKSDATHNHDSRYYTETEIDAKLANYALANHTHQTLTALRITGAMIAGVVGVPNLVFNSTGAPAIDATMPPGTVYFKYIV